MHYFSPRARGEKKNRFETPPHARKAKRRKDRAFAFLALSHEARHQKRDTRQIATACALRHATLILLATYFFKKRARDCEIEPNARPKKREFGGNLVHLAFRGIIAPPKPSSTGAMRARRANPADIWASPSIVEREGPPTRLVARASIHNLTNSRPSRSWLDGKTSLLPRPRARIAPTAASRPPAPSTPLRQQAERMPGNHGTKGRLTRPRA